MKKDRAKPAAMEATSYDYDVFISYSSKDKAWVRGKLLKGIEKAGLHVFIDFRDFTRGAPSIKEMEYGVVKCRKTLLILTPAYIASEWCEIESIMAHALGPANRDLRMIPLLKTPCDKPLRIATLTDVDFTDGADFDLAWHQLLTALGATPEQPQVAQPTRDQWFLAHPYAMPPNFTGRKAERAMLTDWLTHDAAHPLLVLRALGGFGKSALTWHWLLHDVDPAQWPRVVWWSFYENDASFESFVANTQQYLSGSRLDAASSSPRERFDSLLRALHSRGTLLILDGFERALRAFGGLSAAYQGDDVAETGWERDCISPLSDALLRSVASLPGIHSKMLLTTRLRPAPLEVRGGILLEGCREEELVQLQPTDAVEFFHAEGIRGAREEIEAASEPYGYHPLSLRLLAGLIVNDLHQPGDIAAARRVDVNGDLVQRKHHVLEQAYRSLHPVRQELLSRIACFRSPVSYDVLKALAKTTSIGPKGLSFGRKKHAQRPGEASLDADLRDVIARGLLHHDAGTNRFDLHPIVRSYAYDRLAAPDRASSHARLRDYFAAVPEPEKLLTLDDLVPVIELYHHTVRAGRYGDAITLFRARLYGRLDELGGYQLQIELLRLFFSDGEERSSRLINEGNQAWVFNALANSYSVVGKPSRAESLYEVANGLFEKRGDKWGLAIGLSNAASTQAKLGALRTADANFRRSIMLSEEIDVDWCVHDDKSLVHSKLGLLFAYRGAWLESDTELTTAQKILEVCRLKYPHMLGRICEYGALCKLLQMRSATAGDNRQTQIPRLMSAIALARRALDLSEMEARKKYSIRCLRAHWLFGAAHRLVGEMGDAERHLHEALEGSRRINDVELEANVLIDIARLRRVTGALDEAQKLSEEALVITKRSGYLLEGADAHLVLARLAKNRGDAKALREHATEALRLATCDGPPDYTYKAAYDEATALLR